MIEDEVRFMGMPLFEAMDALSAYDLGATDSGIHNEDAARAIREYLRGLPGKDQRAVIARLVRKYLDDDSIEQGYGAEDAVEFAGWIKGLIS